MIFDAIQFSKIAHASKTVSHAGIRALVEWLEKKTGAELLINARTIPFERPDLYEQFQLAQELQKAGVVRHVSPVVQLPDEPPLRLWRVEDTTEQPAGGAHVRSDSAALTAALAEAIERYIWRNESDYLIRPVHSTVTEIARRGAFIHPDRFVSLSEEQLSSNHDVRARQNAMHLWTCATSLITNRSVYLPAQVIGASHQFLQSPTGKNPRIRAAITTGLATWPNRPGALLSGALEIIERDAYMIMWLNQLTLPKVSLQQLCEESADFSAFIAQCNRYRLKVHAVHMLTDAPTHAICVIVEDTSGHAPRFTVGLNAHRSLVRAVTKATTEALRARLFCRNKANEWDDNTPVERIGHRDRLFYWTNPSRAHHLEFLTKGAEQPLAPAEWESDSDEAHLARIVTWCKSKGYEIASAPLTMSKKNVTKWHIESVVIPELTPTYMFESHRQLGGTRRAEIPPLFGYTARSEPYVAQPHPFS